MPIAHICLLLMAYAISLGAQYPKSEDDLQADLHRALGRHHKTQVLNSLLALDIFYARQKLWEKDAEILKQVIAFWSANIQPNSVGSARYSAQLGAVLVRTGDYASAEQLLRSAISIFDQNGPVYMQAAMGVKRTLIDALTGENKSQDASEVNASLPPETPKEHTDTGPRILSKVEAQYSEQARKHHVSGSIMLSVLIDETGQPQSVEVIEPLGFGLDENAIEAVKQWKFQPATLNGSPVSTHSNIEVSFRAMS